MISIITPRSSVGLSDDLPALSVGVRAYTMSTFRQDRRPGKQEARNRLLKIVNENEAFNPTTNNTGTLRHALTLPGPWWHFETALQDRKHWYFTGAESEESLFRLAAIRMPRGASSEDGKRFYVTYVHKSLGCPVVRGLGHKLLLCDVHGYLRSTEHEFGLIWLDLMAPVSRRILYSVVSASERLRGDGAIFALTVQAARENIAMLMEMGGADNRIDFIADVTRGLLGTDFHEVSRFRYNDGAPMVQFVFKRDLATRRKPTDRKLKGYVAAIQADYHKLPAGSWRLSPESQGSEVERG